MHPRTLNPHRKTIDIEVPCARDGIATDGMIETVFLSIPIANSSFLNNKCRLARIPRLADVNIECKRRVSLLHNRTSDVRVAAEAHALIRVFVDCRTCRHIEDIRSIKPRPVIASQGSACQDECGIRCESPVRVFAKRNVARCRLDCTAINGIGV